MNIKELKIAARKSASQGIVTKFFDVTKADIVDTEQKIIEVKFAHFGNKDSDGDILVKGAFAKSIQERGPESATNRKIAFVWQHDIKDPIGKILSIEEREDGAYARVKLSNFQYVPNAGRTWHQLVDGDINQFSFGFSYVWDKVEYDEQLDAFIVKEVKLYEISAVTLGANEMTEFMGVVTEEKAFKSYLKSLSEKDSEQYDKFKRMIMEAFQEAEPPGALTSPSMFERIGQKIN